MPRVLPRTNFNSLSLVRQLSKLTTLDGAASGESLAERLGHWLKVNDAITLFSALSPRSAPVPSDVLPPSGETNLVEELARLRSALARAILADDIGKLVSKAGLSLTTPTPGATAEFVADFAPYRRYYFAQQRSMVAGIGALRLRARDVLSRRTAALQQLAELDGVLDQALGSREQELLATIPLLLEKRFDAVSQQAAAEADAGKWLADFCKDLQSVLLAELEVRLQPVMGLIEALRNEVTTHQ